MTGLVDSHHSGTAQSVPPMSGGPALMKTSYWFAISLATTAAAIASGHGVLGSLLVLSPMWSIALGPPIRSWRLAAAVCSVALARAAYQLYGDLSSIARAERLPVWPGVILRAWIAAGLVLVLVAAVRRGHALWAARFARSVTHAVVLTVWLAVMLPLPLLCKLPQTLESRLSSVVAEVDVGSVRLHSRGYSAVVETRALQHDTYDASVSNTSAWGHLTGRGVVVLVRRVIVSRNLKTE